MSFDWISNFTNSDNYNFDNTKIEFISGTAKLLAQVAPGTAYLYTKLDEDKGLVAIDSTGNGRHGAFQNGLDENDWSTAGKFSNGIEGKGFGLINFDSVGSFERTQPLSIEFWIKFTSATTQIIFSKQLDSGNFQGYAAQVVAGKLRFLLRDASNNRITLETNSTFNDNALHHVVMTYDGGSVAAGVKMYVDNTQAFTVLFSDTLSDTMISVADLQISGRDGANSPLATGTIVDDVVLYSRELTASEVAFRWNSGNGTQVLPGAGTSFPTDNPTIIPKVGIQATIFSGFDASITASGSDNILFTLLVNNVEQYWNGSDWVLSSGYPQANTFADINTNAGSLSITGRTDLNYVAYFHSDDGSTTPEMTRVELNYEFSTVAPALNKNVVEGFLFDLDSNVDTDRVITVRTKMFTFGSQSVITSDEIPVTLNPLTGEFIVDIYTEDVNPDRLVWTFGNDIIETAFLAGTHTFKELLDC